MNLPQHVKVVEVGPRDGLQNEKDFVATATKIELINQLTAAGFVNIEAASFVSPKWVPQMADGREVMAGIKRGSQAIYSQRNINCGIAESIARFEPVAQAAKAQGMRLRGSISCCFGCPYQGDVPLASVLDVIERLAALGCDEIDIADTIGVATAEQTRKVMAAASRVFARERLSGHFHDTYGQALANIYAALQEGIEIFHASVAGLGGCPYAKGATGNVATEDVLYLLHGLGISTGIDLHKVVLAGDFISTAIGRVNASRAGKALLAKQRST